MLCPNCGYFITKRQKTCPKCENSLPEDTGEWSEESSVDIAAQDVRAKSTEEAAEAKVEEDAPEEPPPPEEQPPPKEKDITPAPSGKKSAPAEEIPPDEPSEPGPLFKREKVSPPEPDSKSPPGKASPAEPPEKSEPKKEVRPEDWVGKKYTRPESYQTGGATFSSELGTDWIDKYARSHLVDVPDHAGLGVRFWAGFLDWMLLIAVGVVTLVAGRLIITFIGGSAYSPVELLKLLAWPVGGLWFVVTVVYFTAFIAATGQTPGAIVMDVRVVDVSTGRPPPIGKAFLRAMAYLGGIVALGAGLWKTLFDPEKLPWHDKVAGTSVAPVMRM